MAWYAYCIGEKQSFPEIARHRKPVPMESVLGVSGNQVFLYPASDLAIVVSEHNPAEALSQKSGVDHAGSLRNAFNIRRFSHSVLGPSSTMTRAYANPSVPTSASFSATSTNYAVRPRCT